MTKADKTRQLIIEKTSSLFNIKGYAGTSLADMTGATGLTKGSIYGNFKNKDEVAIAVYEYNTARVTQSLRCETDSKESAIDKLYAITNYYRANCRRMFERGGCPILNTAIEADDNLPFLKKNVQTTIKKWTEAIAKIIELGKQQQQVKKEVDSIEYATMIITLIEGGIMMAKITNNQKLLFNAMDRIEMIIKNELSR